MAVTDELDSYKLAAEQAGLEHQLCLAHWRKAVARRLKKIKGYPKDHKPLRDDLGRRVPRSYQVPETSNACENAIGRAGKVRHKAMRGYQSLRSAIATTFLLASLGGVLAGVSHTSLIT